MTKNENYDPYFVISISLTAANVIQSPIFRTNNIKSPQNVKH